MNQKYLDDVCSEKIDIQTQLNIIDRLRQILMNLDIATLKYEQVCALNYAVLDGIDFIGCLTESCVDETQAIIGKKELEVLCDLKKALHKIRHYYYYNEKNFKIHPWWFGCKEDRDDCTCSSSGTYSSSVECVDCQTRIYFQKCLDLMDSAYTILTDAAERYRTTPVDA